MSDELETNSAETPSKSILELARSRFLLGKEAWSSIHDAAIEDKTFVIGEQWPEEIKALRKKESRPCLTINRLPQFVRQITNEQRQNRPSIKINPFDDAADKDTAKIFQGLIRSIWNNSNGDIAVDTAFEGAVEQSFGFFRIVPQYVDSMSFDQELVIKQIPNSFSVLLDPASKEPDGSDANWGFVVDEISKDEFKAQFPDSKTSQMSDWVTDSDGWMDKEKSICRVAEYFTKELEQIEIVLFSNGVILERSKVPEVLPEGVVEENSRKALVPTIKWYKITGEEILEETEWPGQWIPIIPVYGAIKDVNGRKIIESAIRHAKDSQTAFNFFVSSETEAIALAPKAPFMVANGQIDDKQRNAWATANTKSHAYLTYEPVSVGGQVLGAPQRVNFEPAVQAITNARMQAADDIKATTGIYDASLGNRSNEQSGIAIQRRNIQSQTANFHFVDNLSRSIKHCGRILVDAIPYYYDAARTIRIVGEDDKQEIVKINQTFQDNSGKDKKHSFLVGKYDVVVEVGPNYATQRQEAASTTLELMRSLPNQASVFADVAVRNMDFPGADEVANRLKKTVSPNLLDDKDKPQGTTPEELRQQIQQMQQALQMASQQAEQMNQVIQTKSLELESKERIAFAEMQNKLAIESAKLQHNVDQNIFFEQVEMLHKKLDSLGLSPVEDEIQSEQTEYQNQNFNQSGAEAAIETNGEFQ